MKTRLIAAFIAALLATACAGTQPQTQPQPQPPTQPPRAAPTSTAPTASTPAGGRPIEVSTSAISGVRLGTAADEAESRLKERLGRPVVAALPGCYGESGRSLTWGALTAYLSDAGGKRPVVLRGWLVTTGSNSDRVALPYATAVGQTTDEVIAKVPAARGEAMTEGPYSDAYLVRTTKVPGLLWRAAKKGGAVDTVAYEAEVCD